MTFEDFMAFRLIYWQSMNGKETPVCGLTNEHLANILRYINNNQDDFEQYVKEGMLKEAAVRKLSPEFLSGAPYIVVIKDPVL
jgi:hypothetical protein